MKLVFYINYLNHHQVHVMDELYCLLGDNFCFVATLPRNEKELKGGEDYSMRPYCILSAESDDAYRKAMRLAVEADVCVFGACSQAFAVERAKHHPQGLSFEMGERWLKHGWLTVGSSVFRKWLWNYYWYYRKADFYKLCCSAFTALDDMRIHAYEGRHYKWGYFTEVLDGEKVEAPTGVSTSKSATILWCARFLKLKHPELVIQLARGLKDDGFDVRIDMYGSGPELEATRQLSGQMGVADIVTFCGNVPNADVLRAMREHDIFLFTSDKYEGWGAVLNEAMSSGCAVVASDAIGSVPFMVKDGVNGLVFKSENLDSLCEKTEMLITRPRFKEEIAMNAMHTMVEMWSPQRAAENLLRLIEHLQRGEDARIVEGPCSRA